MSQKLPVNDFKWVENNEINEEFVKFMMKITIKNIFLK